MTIYIIVFSRDTMNLASYCFFEKENEAETYSEYLNKRNDKKHKTTVKELQRY